MILAALSLAGAAAGALGAARENELARKITNRQMADNENAYKQDYFQDYTQRADVQSSMARMREMMRERADASRNTAAVMGSTPEVAVAEQKADNEVLGDTISNVAGQASAYKDNIRNRYLQQKLYIQNKQQQDAVNQANQWSKFAGSALSVGAQDFVPQANLEDTDSHTDMVKWGKTIVKPS